MPRNHYRDFSKGLWLVPDGEKVPAGALRRARGINSLSSGRLRSRWGNHFLYPTSVDPNAKTMSITRFANRRFTIANTGHIAYSNVNLVENGATLPQEVELPSPDFGASFVQMTPSVDCPDDYLFVCAKAKDNDQLIKISPDLDVSRWGIKAPVSNFHIQSQDQQTR